MTYPYLKASPSLGLTTKERFVNDFQAVLDAQFDLASDIWTIEEETTFASEEYQDVEVRINTHIISSATGKPLGDDYKKILFKDLTHDCSLGYLYRFDSNYFIAINTEKIKNLAASVVVKRCNNVLRWRDLNGEYHVEPCSIDYSILRNSDDESPSSLIVTPQGVIEAIVQFNDRTNLIKPNQRFLLGNTDNWTAYRVEGGGVNNYQNTETLDNETVGFIRLTLRLDYVGENDDTVNGIANEEKQVYILTLDQTTLVGVVADTRQVYATVTLNGSTVTRSVDWSSSSIGVATVDSTGLVTFIGVGTATITCHLHGDEDVDDTVAVTVSTTPADFYQVRIAPTIHTSGTITNLVFLNGGAAKDTITRSSGSFITDGFVAGQIINVSGTSNNNKLFTIFSVTALVITLIATDALTNETSNGVIDNVEFISRNYILEGEIQSYAVYLYKNGIVQSDTFTFSVNAGDVPTDHFAFSYSATPGNSFSVENIEMFLTDHLTITCTTVSTTYSGAIEINLRGSW